MIQSNEVVIEEIIGRGAYAQVYKGRWKKLVVAVKKLNSETNEKVKNSFLSEATLLLYAKLQQ